MSNQRNELVLPYAGTSGHSGSDTSSERARRMDTSGKTSDLQRLAMSMIISSEDFGVTWKELADRLNVHHGSASGVLSVLHLAGKIERLTATRNRCKIYVSPDWVFFRPTETPKSKQPKRKTITSSVFQVLGQEVLVTNYPDGRTTVAVRQYPSDTWSPPIVASYTQTTNC
jgi:hypothetical protein